MGQPAATGWNPTHGFASQVGRALEGGFSVASNEAVAEGRVRLTDYPRVLWLLGDEGTADVTFEAEERIEIEAYIAAGGALIVSGSEVGFATDAWLGSALHATYVADDANSTSAGGYVFGVAYEEDFPDVLSGDDTIWSYDTGGAAAVGWGGRVVVVGFPVETLDPSALAPALAELTAYLEP